MIRQQHVITLHDVIGYVTD